MGNLHALNFSEYHLDWHITALQAVRNENRLVHSTLFLLCPSFLLKPGFGSDVLQMNGFDPSPLNIPI